MSQPISTAQISRSRCILLNIASAFFFYGATVAVYRGIDVAGDQSVGALSYAFLRNLIGFLFYLVFFTLNPQKMKFRVPPVLFIRAVFNALALFAFYLSVQYGNAGRANVLNMTYPVFVAMLSGPLLAEKPDRMTLIMLGLGMIGLFMHFSDALIAPQSDQIIGDLFGVFSGITAAVAVLALRGAARVAGSSLILLWMFGTGTVLSFPIIMHQIPQMFGAELPFLLLSAACGLLGQWTLTESYRNLDATTGSVLSGLRIPIALVSGLLFLDEPTSIMALLGGALIFSGNLLLAFKSSRRKL